jgi:predicted phage terminase large subunit-like protein
MGGKSMSSKTLTIRPQQGPQEQALASPADIVIFGGAAGGGKSWALLLEPLRHVENPQFSCVLFRRTYPQVTNPGGMWDESMKLYPLVGATPRQSDLAWKFPSGAVVRFAHLQHEASRLDWQGAQVALLGFDELTHFTRDQFFYMLSRNRSLSGVRPYVRATCNPVPDDDPTGGWIHEFVGWYIGDDGYAISERSGVMRWFVNINDQLHWADTFEELAARFPETTPKSFTFIKSSLYDNQILMREDPGYLANLQALPLVDRERLLGGNWKIKPAAGKVFNRGWFEIIDAAPAGGRTVRFWDLAATEKTVAKDDPDFTAGVKMRRVGDVYYVLDAIAVQEAPGRVDTLIKNTASQDGTGVAVRFEREGGASGVRDARNTVTMMAGYDVRAVSPQGDKVTRSKGMAAQAEAGNVKLVRGPWNDRYLRTLHSFPEGAHDDEVDASSGAFNDLVREVRQPSTQRG